MLEKDIIRQKKNIFNAYLRTSENKEIFSNNNKVLIYGIIEDELEYDFEVQREVFYRTHVAVKRTSGVIDHIPIVISERLKGFNIYRPIKGNIVEIAGQFCSVRRRGFDGNFHLDLYLLVTAIKMLDEEEDYVDNNIIYLEGTLQKNPVYRQTPRGIEIADIMLLVRKRDDYKGYLIPCIAWNGVATYSRILKCKDKVKLCGRIQSRKYKKVIDKDLLEEHVAYEVSITKIVKI